MIDLLLPLLVLIFGLGLLAAENLLPTSGILGILSGFCFLCLLYVGFSISTRTGLTYLAVEAVMVPLTYGISSYLIARTGLGRLVSLRPPQSHELDTATERPDLGFLLGQTVRVMTTLRPSGTVEFDGRRFEGIAEQGLIPSGSAVQVVQVRSGRLVVRHASASGQENSPGAE